MIFGDWDASWCCRNHTMSARPALGCRRPDSIRPRSDCPPLTPRCPRSPVSKLVTSCAHCSPAPPGSSELDSLLFSLTLHFLGAFLPPGERAPQTQGPVLMKPHTHPVGSCMPQFRPHSAHETSELLPQPVRIMTWPCSHPAGASEP